MVAGSGTFCLKASQELTWMVCNIWRTVLVKPRRIAAELVQRTVWLQKLEERKVTLTEAA